MGLALLALFVFGKILAPGIGMWIWDKLFNPPRRNRHNFDFDQLVESKKNVLQQGSGMAPRTQSSTTSAPPRPQKTCPTHQKYLKELAKISQQKTPNAAQKAKQKSLQSLLAVFDALQWGDGQEFDSIAQQISHKLGLRIENRDAVRVIKMSMERRWILSLRSPSLPGLAQLITLWECYLFWDILLKELNHREGPLCKGLGSKLNVSYSDLQKAVTATLAKLQKRNIPARDILQGKISLPSVAKLEGLASRLILSQNGQSFRTKRGWIKALSDEATFYSSLSPLPPLQHGQDEEGARQILGVGPDASLQEIKKAYKKWALLKHPDKLSARGIPSEFGRIATENFALIQRAYEILKLGQS